MRRRGQSVSVRPIIVIGVGAGGIDELRTKLGEDSVFWSLLRFQVGSGDFARTKYVALHFNYDKISALKRGKLNARTPEALSSFGDVHARLEVTSLEDFSVETVCGRLLHMFDHDEDMKGGAKGLMEEYEKLTREARQRTRSSCKMKPMTVRERPGGMLAVSHVLGDVGLPDAPHNWLMLTPDGQLYNAGYGGFNEMKEWADDTKVLFGVIRLSFGSHGAGSSHSVKHVFFHWVGPDVPALQKGKCNAQKQHVVEKIMEYVRISMTWEWHSKEDIVFEDVIHELQRITVTDAAGTDVDMDIISADAYEQQLERELEARKHEDPDCMEDDEDAGEPIVPEIEPAVHGVKSDDVPWNWLLLGIDTPKPDGTISPSSSPLSTASVRATTAKSSLSASPSPPHNRFNSIQSAEHSTGLRDSGSRQGSPTPSSPRPSWSPRLTNPPNPEKAPRVRPTVTLRQTSGASVDADPSQIVQAARPTLRARFATLDENSPEAPAAPVASDPVENEIPGTRKPDHHEVCSPTGDTVVPTVGDAQQLMGSLNAERTRGIEAEAPPTRLSERLRSPSASSSGTSGSEDVDLSYKSPRRSQHPFEKKFMAEPASPQEARLGDESPSKNVPVLPISGVKKDSGPQLLHVWREDNKTHVTELPLASGSLSQDGCYVLDATPRIYVWTGQRANTLEREAAYLVAADRETLRGRDKKQATHEVDHRFWELLSSADAQKGARSSTFGAVDGKKRLQFKEEAESRNFAVDPVDTASMKLQDRTQSDDKFAHRHTAPNLRSLGRATILHSQPGSGDIWGASKHGTLSVRTGWRWHKRYFQLHNGHLRWWNSVADCERKPQVAPLGTVNFVQGATQWDVLRVNGCHVEISLPMNSQRRWRPVEKFTLAADSSAIADEWAEAISSHMDCVHALLFWPWSIEGQQGMVDDRTFM